ncbi:receptor protein kinase TMK1 [Trifolium repens]|nr:receptor protein kinase TMK1 [Trifolium repens]
MGFRVSYVLQLMVLFFLIFVCAWCQDDDIVMKKLKTTISKNDLDWSDKDFCNWEKVSCSGTKRVTSIELRSSNVEGYLPKELVQLTELTYFRCSVNILSGDFPYMSNSLQKLYIDSNKFTSMPSDFFTNMSNLIEVKIDSNPFSQWQIPYSLENCLALQTFSAVNVSFVGKIPEFFGKDTFPSLITLQLSFNFLEGNLPNSLSGSSIQTLWVNGQKSNNQLNGTLSVLQNMTSLQQIWVHGNSFTGTIPDFSNHDQLFDVSLRDNKLTGVVPSSLTKLESLKIVNLTNNDLQGSPPKFQDGVQVDMDMDKGRHSFCTEVVGQPCSPLVNVLLTVVEPFGYPLKLAQSWQGNDPCHGPNWLGIVCSSGGNIIIIDFENKGFSGSISPSFASLSSVTKLRLANNNLTGIIPKELASMPALKLLDVSNNSLYGQIPSFRTDVVVITSGNPDIGKDKPRDSSSGGEDKKKIRVGAIVGIVMGIVGLLGVGVFVFIMYGKRHHKRDVKVQTPNAIVVHPRHSGDGNAAKIRVAASESAGAVVVVGGTGGFNLSSSVQNVEVGNMVISIQVLREVTNNFSDKNILGKGGFGTVYKGELDDGTKIAVKRMQSETVGDKGMNEFKSEIAVLTKVRHRHFGCTPRIMLGGQ